MTASADELLARIRGHGDLPRHVAVIMDGNGRWARSRDLPRSAGHQAGMRSVQECLEGAGQAGVQVVSLFAFSQENWQRPADEVDALMALLQEYVAREGEKLVAQGVTVRVLGDLERLSAPARAAVDAIQEATAAGSALRLNICLSYGSRAELARAARLLAEDVQAGRLAPSAIDEAAVERKLYTSGCPDPDLVIRTSGEYRISNFLLWQSAYAEFHVLPVLWPDFSRRDLFEAILEYQRRERRFGRVPQPS